MTGKYQTRSRRTRSSESFSSRGAALIVCLWIIILVAIIAVGISNLMRIERKASASHLDRMQAVEFSRMGMDAVVATILKSTAATNYTWASTPGQIFVGKEPVAPGNNESAPGELIRLSSGVPTNLNPQPPVLAPPNLNVPTFADPSRHVITEALDSTTGTTVQMPLKWIYVRQNGDLDFSETPDATNKTNSLVGRFAYWCDDESSKINVNLAWTRDATNQSLPGSPTRVNLNTLPGMTPTLAAEIHEAVTPDAYASSPRFFNSPEDISRLGQDAASVLLDNRFEITHYNHDPDTTFFNESRIVLTTKHAIANPGLAKGDPDARPYLEVLKNENGDPGDYDNIDSAKLTATINKLKTYLQRTDWPLAPGSSFQEKYYGDYSEPQKSQRLIQLALNIIDYVRCKESSQELVPQTRGSLQADGTFSFGATGATGSNAFTGLTRSPSITEIGVWLSPDMKQLKFKVELHLPLKYGVSSVDVDRLYWLVSFVDKSGKLWSSTRQRILASQCSPSAKLDAGDYVTVTRTINNGEAGDGGTIVDLPFASRPASLKVRAFITYKSGGQGLDTAPLVSATSSLIDCPVDSNTIPESGISTVEVDDPRCNKHKDDWKSRSGNSLSAPNSIRSVGQSPSAVSPEQDTDQNGKLTDYSLDMPPPKGSADNLKGLVTSIAELGYIHTGLEGSAKAGVPWRTLHLQPSALGNTIVPDWAFMDLFAVPAEAPQESALQVLAPNKNSVGGRVNLNSKVEPFSMERLRPLVAVLLGAKKGDGTTIDLPTAITLAGNIYNQKLAERGKSYGSLSIFDSPGEVAEIEGIADAGESSEELLRQISNQVTARGGVFSIYAIGQTLKQTPDGRLIVLAEQRTQSFIERIQDTSGNIKARTIYNRRLSP